MVYQSNSRPLGTLAQQIVDLNNQISLAQPRNKRKNKGLKEMEFLTLCHLRNKDLMNVGDIQKLLGFSQPRCHELLDLLKTET